MRRKKIEAGNDNYGPWILVERKRNKTKKGVEDSLKCNSGPIKKKCDNVLIGN